MQALLYCHNVHGLGHIVRSSQIAAAVVNAGGRATIVTGCAALDAVPIDSRVSVRTIPPIRPASPLRFEAVDRALAGTNVMRLRAERILEAARAVRPDVVLADLLPLGLGGELCLTLGAARAEGWPTTFVWGIPYIDVSVAAARQPANPSLLDAYRMYESAIAYEDPSAADLFQRLPAWALPPRRAVVGLVAEGAVARGARSPGLIVVACGGGTTAASLCRTTVAAKQLLPSSLGVRLRLVAGPLADLGEIQAIAADAGDVEVIGAATLGAVVSDAHVVVSRAGYNSVAQLLQSDFPLIFVPFAGGSGDQGARATRLGRGPGVEVVEEGAAGAAHLAEALQRALTGPPAFARPVRTCSGAAAAARWLLETPERARA